MSPEALERLRERASMQTSGGVTLVRSHDLRALLAAFEELRTENGRLTEDLADCGIRLGTAERAAIELRARVAELEARSAEWADAQRVFLTAEARVAELEADVAKRESNRQHAEQWRANLERRAEKAERDAAVRYDCKGGPGTTTPACGGCVTCLHRVIEKAEADLHEVVEALRGEVAARKRTITEPYEVSREWTRQQKVDAILAKYPVKP